MPVDSCSNCILCLAVNLPYPPANMHTGLQAACTCILLPCAATCFIASARWFLDTTAQHPAAPRAQSDSRNRHPPLNRYTPDQPQPLNPTPARPGAEGAAAPAPRSPTPRWTRRPCSSRRPPSQARPADASPARPKPWMLGSQQPSSQLHVVRVVCCCRQAALAVRPKLGPAATL